MHFTDNDTICEIANESQITLWNFRDNEIIWQTDTSISLREARIHITHGKALIYCEERMHGARSVVVDIKTGEVLWRSYGVYIRPAGGRNMAFRIRVQSSVVDIIDLNTGDTLLTFCPLPEGDWIVWNAEGYWDGTASATDYVKFYLGAEMLDASRVVALKDPSKAHSSIDAVLAGKSP